MLANSSQFSRDIHDVKLAYLSSVLGSTNVEVGTFLSRPGAIGLTNIVSLMSSEMDTLVTGTERVPSEALNIFQRTVEILTEDFLTSPVAELPQNQISSFHETYSDAQKRLKTPNRLLDHLKRISDWFSVVTDARQPSGNPLGNV